MQSLAQLHQQQPQLIMEGGGRGLALPRHAWRMVTWAEARAPLPGGTRRRPQPTGRGVHARTCHSTYYYISTLLFAHLKSRSCRIPYRRSSCSIAYPHGFNVVKNRESGARDSIPSLHFPEFFNVVKKKGGTTIMVPLHAGQWANFTVRLTWTHLTGHVSSKSWANGAISFQLCAVCPPCPAPVLQREIGPMPLRVRSCLIPNLGRDRSIPSLPSGWRECTAGAVLLATRLGRHQPNQIGVSLPPGPGTDAHLPS